MIDRKKQIQEYYGEMLEQKAVVKQSLFQQILIVSTGILGFVVALHNANNESHILCILYIVALCSLALTSVFSLFVLIGYASLPERTINAIIDNVKELLTTTEDYFVGPTIPQWTVMLQKITPWIFTTGVILLALYSILIANI